MLFAKALTFFSLLLAFTAGAAGETKLANKDQKTSTRAVMQSDSQFSIISPRLIADVAAQQPAASSYQAFLKEFESKTDDVDQLLTIYRNIALIENSLFEAATGKIIGLLLSFDQHPTADRLIEKIEEENDALLLAEIDFQKAKLAFQNADCTPVTALLRPIISAGVQLDSESNRYAQFMYGACLQKNSQHRSAFTLYKNSGEDEQIDDAIRINRAIGYMHQGWWSDAERELDTIVKDYENAVNLRYIKSAPLRPHLDRILLLKGYMQIHYERFRDARKSFGRISLQSEQFDQGLLGLGLAALGEKDYKGAMNAFEKLAKKTKQRQFSSLAQLEVPLLIGFIYERQGRSDKAIESYTRAQAIYTQQLKLADSELAGIQSFVPRSPRELIQFIEARQKGLYKIKGSDANALLRKLKVISLLDEKAALALSVEQVKTYARLQNKNIELRKSQIQSYLSQAQYGVANLFDTGKNAE